MWGFTEIEHLSIRELENRFDVDVILKINLARKYSIESWLRPAFAAIMDREEALTDDEVQRLGWKLASQIGRIRETRYRRHIEHIQTHLQAYKCMACWRLHDVDKGYCCNCTRQGLTVVSTAEHTFSYYAAITYPKEDPSDFL